MSCDIKIFMCAHKQFDVIPAFTTVIQGGAALNSPLEGAISDAGKSGSISEKNPDYCELTVQYYAWKNENADYYGFCHYRRFLSFDESISKPYLVFGKKLSKKFLDRIKDEISVRKFIESCDIVVPKLEDMGCDVATQYSLAPGCTEEDFKLFRKLIEDEFPFLSEAAEEYFSQSKQYFCNMFVMKKALFFDYCEKLFHLLELFDIIKSPDGKIRGDRVDGFLAERFLGVYILFLRKNGKNIREVARLDIECSIKKRILYKLFPPENKMRHALKNILNEVVNEIF